MRIPLSCFGYSYQLREIEESGYNYIELHHAELLEMEEDVFLTFAENLKNSSVDCAVVNNPYPLAQRIALSDFDVAGHRRGLEKVAQRMNLLGATYWNFGNGFARQLSTGDDCGVAKQKVDQAIDQVAEVAKAFGLQVLIEPLGASITNYMTTIDEVLDFIEQSEHDNLAVFVDMRWFIEEGRPMSDLHRYCGKLVHAHIDNPFTDYARQKIRVVPKLNDGYDYTPYLDFIKSDDFDGILSVEANTFTDFRTDIEQTISFFAHHGIEPME